MRNLKFSFFILLTIGLLNSCNFISNYFKYRDTTKELVNDILKKDYDNAVKLFALEHPSFAGTSPDTLKSKLPAFRDLLVKDFGDHLDFTMMNAEKKWSTEEGESTPPNTTVVMMQIANDKEFGVLKVWFDDNSKKVVFIKTLDVKEPIPNMIPFWLFGLLALCVPVFNIYMIVRVKRSQFKKKWLKYLAIILLNVPPITYKAVGGLSFGLLSFQILLGVSFEYMSYLGSFWTFGLPLGGLYILWQLYKGKDKPIEETSNEIIETEQQTNSNENTEGTATTEI